ncbi:MAG: hypothetical protein AAGA56_12505 [Myxococcota bacterium]
MSWLGAGPLLGLVLSAAACQDVCPAGREAEVDPAGRSCTLNRDCNVECACGSDEDRVGRVVGRCEAGTCNAPDPLCAAACQPDEYNDIFCAAD